MAKSINRASIGTLMLGAALLTTAGIAEAKPIYKAAIPNPNAFDCLTCHVPGQVPGEDQLNPFGLDVQLLLLEPQAGWWETLWMLDSDLDGQTNGQELGDPCGNWMPGDIPWRLDEISAPGDLDSLSLDPDTGCEPPPGMGGMGGTGGMGAGGMSEVGEGGDGGFGGGSDPGEDADEQPPPVNQGPKTFTSQPAGVCSFGTSSDSSPAWFAAAALGLVVMRRRRSRA